MQFCYKILGELIARIIQEQITNTDKRLFLKLEGFKNDTIPAIIDEIERKKDYYMDYNLKIKTTDKVDSYEQYYIGIDTTSTLLRNTLSKNEILILIINSQSNEWQSLKDIFTIDENFLLENKQIESLLRVDYDESGKSLGIDEKNSESIKIFFSDLFEVYKPQLMTIIEYLLKVNEIYRDTHMQSITIYEALGEALPVIGMFKYKDIYNMYSLKKIDPKTEIQKLYYASELLNNRGNLLDISKTEDKINNSDELDLDEKNVLITFLETKDPKAYNLDWEVVRDIFSNKIIKKSAADKFIEILSEENQDIEEFDREVEEKLKNGSADINDIDLVIQNHSITVKSQKALRKLIGKTSIPTYDDFCSAVYQEICYFIRNTDLSGKIIVHFDSKNIEVEGINYLTKKTFTLLYKGIEDKLNNFVIFKDMDKIYNSVDDNGNTADNELKFKIYQENNDNDFREFKWHCNDGLIKYLHDVILRYKEILTEKNVIPILSDELNSFIGIPSQELFESIWRNIECKYINVFESIQENIKANSILKQDSYDELNKCFQFFEDEYCDWVKKLITFNDINGILGTDFSYVMESYNNLLKEIIKINNNTSNSMYISSIINKMFCININNNFVMMTFLHPIKVYSYLSRVEYFIDKIKEFMTNVEKINKIRDIDIFLDNEIENKNLNYYPAYLSDYESGNKTILEAVETNYGFTLYKNNNRSDIYMNSAGNYLICNICKNICNYINVCPSSMDGINIFFINCSRGNLIKEVVDYLIQQNITNVKLNITLHVDSRSSDTAYIYNEINKYVSSKEEFKKASNSYFSNIQINVLNCSLDELFNITINDKKDIAILVDYFHGLKNLYSVKFQKDKYQETKYAEEQKIHKGFITPGNMYRELKVISEKQNEYLRNFYNLQYSIYELNNNIADSDIYGLVRDVSLSSEANNIRKLHDIFNWVICYDENVDKFLMGNLVNRNDVVIEYIPNINKDDNRNLTISSSKGNMNSLKNKIYKKLERLLNKQLQYSQKIIDYIIDQAVAISGDLVLKSIGSGKFLNELLGVVFTKFIIEHQNINNEKGIWLYFDDFEGKWYKARNKRPDLIYLSVSKLDDKIYLDLKLVECKFIERSAFKSEKKSAIEQIREGKNIIDGLFGNDYKREGLRYWINDLVNSIIESNADIGRDKTKLVEELLNISSNEAYNLIISSDIFIFCYDDNIVGKNVKIERQKIGNDTIKIYEIDRKYILTILREIAEKSSDLIISQELDENNELDARTKVEDIFEDVEETNNTSNTSDAVGFSVLNKDTSDNNQVNTIEKGNSIDNTNSNEIDEKDYPESEKVEINITVEKPATDDLNSKINKDNESSNGDICEREMDNNNDEIPEYKIVRKEVLDKLKQSSDEEVSEAEHKRIQDNIMRLKKELSIRGIQINVEDYKVGPDIVEIHFTLGTGVDINSIIKHSQNMMLWLKVNSEPYIFIRNGMVNLQIERERRKIVNIKNVLQAVDKSNKFTDYKTKFYAIIGVDILGEPYAINFADANNPHLLLAGATGTGKSVTLRSILVSIMAMYTPDEVEFILIDPKQVELKAFEVSKYVKRQTVIEPEEAVNVLKDMIDEMEKRYTLFRQARTSDIIGYNKKNPENQVKRILIVFDEYADFMESEFKDELESHMKRLSAKARAAGIHLIVCTQTPKAEIITTTIRNNLTGRIALKVAGSQVSNLILGSSGAEKLLGKGDMLFASGETPVPIRLKAPFTDEDEAYEIAEL